MRKVLHVAWREYVETAKTKLFIISVFLTPLIIGGTVLFGRHLQKKIEHGSRPAQHVAVVDRTAVLAEALEEAFQDYNASHPQRRIEPTVHAAGGADATEGIEKLKADVRDRELAGCLVIAEDAVAGGGAVAVLHANRENQRHGGVWRRTAVAV